MRTRFPAILWTLCLIVSALGSTGSPAGSAGAGAQEFDPAQDPSFILDRAKLAAGTIPGQARALADLAWSADPAVGPRVRAAARLELVRFGDEGLIALAEALRTVAPRFQADVVAVMIDARFYARSGIPPRYLPALDSAIWSGTIEARRLAMNEVSRYGSAISVLPIVDAIHEDPELILPGIESLGLLRQPQASRFLDQVLRTAPPPLALAAGAALAQLGEQGRAVLRGAAASDDRAIRQAAVAGLTPVAEVGDLALLREFLALSPAGEDDVVRRAREKVSELERPPPEGPPDLSDVFDPGS